LRKISEAKSLFFKKINKIEKSLGRCVKEKKKIQATKIRSGNGDTTTNSVET
jgi:hypothetical protein